MAELGVIEQVPTHMMGQKPIIARLSMENAVQNLNCVFMFSRSTHDINDIFYLILSKYNVIPEVDTTHKTNIMQFTHANKNGIIHIYAADPNVIHVITYKEVKFYVKKMRLNGRTKRF